MPDDKAKKKGTKTCLLICLYCFFLVCHLDIQMELNKLEIRNITCKKIFYDFFFILEILIMECVF